MGLSLSELKAIRAADDESVRLGQYERAGHPIFDPVPGIDEPVIQTLEAFVAVDEPGVESLLGDESGALIPEGGDVMVYGDGGAGKTTLLFDLACHLAAGKDWLGIPVARPVRVLIVENEGPRPLLREKLRRKLDAWDGPPLDQRISVFAEPWGRFTFSDETWRGRLATVVRDHEIDVLIAGPLTRLGMDSAGTLQETAAFMALVDDVRRQSGRRLTPIVAHHENRAGTVSGAWEGAGDTLLHVQAAGNGRTILNVQKARWASNLHHTALKLRWTDGEGFEIDGDRDYLDEIQSLLSDGTWRVLKEIAKTADGGIGASETTVKRLLEDNRALFALREGDEAKALGMSPKARLWGLRSAVSAVSAVDALQGAADGTTATALTLKGEQSSDAAPSLDLGTALDPQRSPA